MLLRVDNDLQVVIPEGIVQSSRDEADPDPSDLVNVLLLGLVKAPESSQPTLAI